MKNEIKNNKIITGIIYIRVSSDEQVKGTSLDEQLNACQRYCEEKGLKSFERRVNLQKVQIVKNFLVQLNIVERIKLMLLLCGKLIDLQET